MKKLYTLVFALMVLLSITMSVEALEDKAMNPQTKVPTLVVFVHVINDDLGIKNASDFAVTVTAKDPSPPYSEVQNRNNRYFEE